MRLAAAAQLMCIVFVCQAVVVAGLGKKLLEHLHQLYLS